MLAEQPDSTLRAEITFLVANAQFAQGKYDEAAASYHKYLDQYKDGTHVEDAVYRIALGSLFSGKYEEATKQLQAYMAKYPQGEAIPDAKYRLAVCDTAAQDYKKVIAECQDWLKQYPHDQQQGEVLSLLGDAYTSTDKPDEAFDAYQRSYKAATTDEVLNYALFEAAKIPRSAANGTRWTPCSRSSSRTIRTTRQSCRQPIGSAAPRPRKARATRPSSTSPASSKSISTIQPRGRRAVARSTGDDVHEEEAVAVAAASPVASASAPPAVAEATPAPTPEATPDPGIELDQLLGSSEKDQSPTARARVLYAKSQLARLRHQPAEAERNLLTIADLFKPEVLSPPTLGLVGDALLAKGKLDEAAPFYQYLMDYYHKSDWVDFAYNGLGEIAFQKKHYDKALQLFTDATDKIAANRKLKDVTVGQAKTLLALGKYDEAKKIFEQAASVREWRGETTAFCIYSIGQIEARQNHWAEANSYYQRVFVAYQKFLPWVAKAYIGSAESLEKLGKTQDAINTYREMLRNEKLADFPETTEARQRLAALGAS